MDESYRIETEINVKDFLDKLHYSLDNGGKVVFQKYRKVDSLRDEKYTNEYTVNALFPFENLEIALSKELKTLTTENYIKTVKDIRFLEKYITMKMFILSFAWNCLMATA
ncbi:MAG: hypothetical protein MJ146_00650 [Clostridia bacterium]|nr:hypothetical protein [Clostridia bacterium]